VDPQIINEFPLAAKIILYVGVPVIVGLCTAIGVLWKAKEARDIYIREQDKANLQVLNNLTKMFELIHIDISRLPSDVSKELSGILNDIKITLQKK